MYKSRFIQCSLCLSVAVIGGCAVPPTRTVYVETPVPPRYNYVEPAPVSSVYVEPPLYQPAPINAPWAPPPMLVEAPPPVPYPDAVWTGGYWVWEGEWVWAHGRWIAPPAPHYQWVHPYYEHRGETVIFINGFWAAPGVRFVAPALSLSIAIAIPRANAIPGPRPVGPQGVFVPPPPGSRAGLIVPAPVGTPPAIVTSAPPVVNIGMHIGNNVTNNTTVINNTTNITNFTIVAPATATANGQSVSSTVPGQAHLAAAMKPVVHAPAPAAEAGKPMPGTPAGHPPAAPAAPAAPAGHAYVPDNAAAPNAAPHPGGQAPVAAPANAPSEPGTAQHTYQPAAHPQTPPPPAEPAPTAVPGATHPGVPPATARPGGEARPAPPSPVEVERNPAEHAATPAHQAVQKEMPPPARPPQPAAVEHEPGRPHAEEAARKGATPEPHKDERSEDELKKRKRLEEEQQR